MHEIKKLQKNRYYLMHFKTYNVLNVGNHLDRAMELLGAKREVSKHIPGHYLYTL